MLISPAFAQAAAPAAAPAADPLGGLTSFIPLILMFVVLWFLMIRPQMKKQKEHQKMVTALQKGDLVVTQGGMIGRIVKVAEAFVVLDVAELKGETVEVTVQKQAIGAMLPKDSVKV